MTKPFFKFGLSLGHTVRLFWRRTSFVRSFVVSALGGCRSGYGTFSFSDEGLGVGHETFRNCLLWPPLGYEIFGRPGRPAALGCETFGLPEPLRAPGCETFGRQAAAGPLGCETLTPPRRRGRGRGRNFSPQEGFSAPAPRRHGGDRWCPGAAGHARV